MGGGAGELDLVAAAVRLQCAVRGVAARQVVGRALLVRRQAESIESDSRDVRLRSRLRWGRPGGRPSEVQDVLGKGGWRIGLASSAVLSRHVACAALHECMRCAYIRACVR